MERRLKAYSESGGRVIIVRAGDYFGPNAGNNWFSQGLIKPGLPITKVTYPGVRGLGHQWAYLPDVARTIVEALARRDSLQRFATIHMKGHWDHDGTQIVRAIQRVVAGRTAVEPTVAAFPWWFIALAAPFVTTFRELLEMRYLWRIPLRLDNAHLEAVIGPEPHTPLDQAVEETLAGLGCLDSSPSRRSEPTPVR
jgi:nucleoside-diphosphate-sugar epimerase